MPGYNDNPAFSQGSNGGVFPNPGAALSDPNDYLAWDWKMIKSAIVGYAAVTNSGQRDAPQSDPKTLWDSAVTFHRTQALLKYLSRNVSLQAAALAGPDGAWKGTAADSFRGMMDTLAAKLQAKGDQIAGGPSGTNSVPVQIHNSGNYLKWAQDAINAIDNYYGSWAAQQPGGRLPNGLAYISHFPGLPEQMGDDMKKVVRVLAAQYVDTYDAVVVPDTSGFNSPNTNTPPPPPTSTPPPGGDVPPPPGDVPSPGDVPPPGAGDVPPPGGADVSPPPSSDLSALPPPTGPGGGPGGGGGGLDGIEPPPSPPGIGSGPGGLDLPPPAGVGGPGSGGAGIGGLPPSLGIGAPGGVGSSSTPAVRPPGSATVGGPPGTGSSGDLGEVDPVTGLPRPTDWSAPGAGGADLGLDRPGAGGAPMMPPMMPPGGASPGSGAERPDAAGLLGGVEAPWEGGLSSSLGDPTGTNPPAIKPEDWAAPGSAAGLDSPGVGGAPMAPPMMPPTGSAGQGGAAERPDAAGLLGGVEAPWEGGLPSSLGDPTGTNPPAIKSEDWAAQSDGGTGQVPLGSAPMMPPGTGAAPQAGAAERPDSAGLLGGEREPWESGASDQVGDPSEVPSPPVEPETWAPTPADQAVAAPQGGAAPMVPPVLPPGAGTPPGAGAERPDAAALLGGEWKSWEGTTNLADLDAPAGALHPATRPEEWAVVAQGTVAGTSDQQASASAEELVVYPDVDVDSTPAAAPEGWSASTPEVGVPVPGEAPAPVTEEIAALDATGVGFQEAAVALATTGAGTAAAHTPATAPAANPVVAASDAAGAGTSRREDRGAGPIGPHGGEYSLADGKEPVGVPGIDSVVVVRAPDAVENTAAWDDDSFSLLSRMLPFAIPAIREGREGAEVVVDRTLRSTEPWERGSGEPYAIYRRKRFGEVDPIVEDEVVMCGDESSLPVDERETFLASLEENEDESSEEDDGDLEDEHEERSMADLLNQDDSAWGSRSTKPTGILE